jgi:OPA family glycerol-3-phosphate transporter-like MFS transporter
MQTSIKEVSKSTRKFLRVHFWFLQNLTIILLFIGYTGYYACRSWFAVIKPLLIEEYELLLIDLEVIGFLTSIGTVGYALGKIIGSAITDFLGGKLIFVLGMVISVLCTLSFGVSNTLLAFGFAWGANRLAQALGWGAMVKIVAQWFSYRNYGKVMAILSLSFLIGDSLWRWLMGKILLEGFGWRGILFLGATALSVIALINWLFLSSKPPRFAEEGAQSSPVSLFGEAGHFESPQNIAHLFRPYLKSYSFWLMALMSLGLTFTRETINEWLNTYIAQIAGVSAGIAAQYSAIFPFAGGVSVLVVGFLSDHIFRGNRAIFIALFQFILALLFGYLYWGNFTFNIALLPLVIATIAFLLMGPYSFLAGAMALDLGGKAGSAAASFLADAVGYLASVLAGYGIAKIVKAYHWNQVFLLLSIIAFLSALVAALFVGSIHKKRRSKAKN